MPRKPLVPKPQPVAQKARALWFDGPAQPAFGRVVWSSLDAQAEAEASAMGQARRERVERPKSRHGY